MPLLVRGIQVGDAVFVITNPMTLHQAAKLYLGLDKDPYSQSPESLGMSLEQAQLTVWRQDADLRRLVGVFRAKVQTGQIIPGVRHNDPNGLPDEQRTDIFLSDVIQVAMERGDASPVLNLLVDEWRRERGIGIPIVRAGRPSQRDRMLEVLKQMDAEGRLSGTKKEIRLAAMERLKLPGGEPGWSVVTFGKVMTQFRRSADMQRN
jgi:hypothetical protein